MPVLLNGLGISMDEKRLTSHLFEDQFGAKWCDITNAVQLYVHRESVSFKTDHFSGYTYVAIPVLSPIILGLMNRELTEAVNTYMHRLLTGKYFAKIILLQSKHTESNLLVDCVERENVDSKIRHWKDNHSYMPSDVDIIPYTNDIEMIQWQRIDISVIDDFEILTKPKCGIFKCAFGQDNFCSLRVKLDLDVPDKAFYRGSVLFTFNKGEEETLDFVVRGNNRQLFVHSKAENRKNQQDMKVMSDEKNSDVDDNRNEVISKRSVLFLNDEWGTSKGGISSVNRQLALQARDAGYAVYVTVLDSPNEQDKKDAENNRINLIIAETIPDVDQNINLNMLNYAHQRYFPSLEKNITNLGVIIGHVPITSEGAQNIKQRRFPKVKVYLFTHVIPQDTDFHMGRSYKLGDIETKVDKIIQQAEQADLIFSVGPKVYRKFKNEFRGSEVNDDKHKEFIPIPDSRFFDLDLKPFEKDHAYEILTVGRVSNVENLKGYDIVAAALGKVATRSSSVIDGLLWRIRGISEEDKDESLAFIKKHLKSVNGNLLDIYPLQYGNQKLVTQDIQKSRLFLMPSRTEPFGMVGLEAIAAGIPVLVTANSGLADFLKEHFPKHMHDSMVVSKLGKTDNNTDDIAIWFNRITDVLLNKYDDTFDLARQVKDKLTQMKSHPNSQIFKDELWKLK
ncbi:uncharacterized protein [Ptychodera flava]|uniref:uncharacterized protein n=1 Tax=Ptychodera flava TaxID=63121 RepID=UPI00396A3FA6